VIDRTEPSKKVLHALEKVFIAEIEGRLPFQSRAKVYNSLCDEGLLTPMTMTLGGRFPASISGYQLTHAGRIIYCESCRDYPDDELTSKA
jgi:hypothetical protein